MQTFSVKVKHGIKLPPRQTLRNSSEELVIDLEKYDNGVEVFDTGYAFGRVNGLYENINSKTDHAFAEVYLWNLLGIYKNIQQLASMGSLSSDEDPRIREMTADEIASRTETIDKWQQKLVLKKLNKFKPIQMLTYFFSIPSKELLWIIGPNQQRKKQPN